MKSLDLRRTVINQTLVSFQLGSCAMFVLTPGMLETISKVTPQPGMVLR